MLIVHSFNYNFSYYVYNAYAMFNVHSIKIFIEQIFKEEKSCTLSLIIF